MPAMLMNGLQEQHPCSKLPISRMLLIPGTGNGERGTGNRERESGNKCTAATLLRVQNGGQNKRKGSKRNNLG